MQEEKPEENREILPVPVDSREIVEQKGVRCDNCGRTFSREKIFCPVCGLRHTEDTRFPSDTLILQPGLERTVRSCRVFSLLSLILGIAGPLALGIGWLLAIIFGFMALNKRGFARDRKFALWGITLGFMWPVAIACFGVLFSYRSATEKRVQKNETSIMEGLRNIAITQRYVKGGYFFDRDNDGESEYADFADLSGVGYIYFDPAIISGERYGYSIQMDVLKEKGYRIRAYPQIYRTTGRRSFYIDDTGFLRSGDIENESSFDGWGKLSKVKKSSIFDEFDDEIAGDLLELARKLAKERDFARSRKILSEIKDSYYMSSASSGVGSVIESINVYIAEDKAKESYQNALQLAEESRYRMALTVLKDVEKSYPDVMIIPDVKRKREEVEKTLAEVLEQEAKTLFSEGQKLELQGDYDEALLRYRKIVNELDSTSYLSRAKELLPVVKGKREEKKAESIFANLSALKPEESYTEMLNAISVLEGHYSETALAEEKKAYLTLLKGVCLGHREKDKAKQEFQKEHFQAAVQAGEKALHFNPGLEKDMNSVLQTSYFRLAEGYFKNKAFTDAVPYYEKWFKLSLQEDSTGHKHYVESLYQLGKSDYLSGKYKEAKENLLGLKKYLGKRGEFWYLLGSISAVENDYKHAIGYFKLSLKLDARNAKAWYKKGLCEMTVVCKLEEEFSKKLEQLNVLKHGMDTVVEITAVINEISAKHVELGIEARPKVLEGKTKLTADQIKRKKLAKAERGKFLAQAREKSRSIEAAIRNNQGKREKVLSEARKVCDAMAVAHSNLKKALSLDILDIDLSELITVVYEKNRYFAVGYTQLGTGLNQEKQLEERAMRYLERAISAFGKARSVSDYAEEIHELHEPFRRAQMTKNVSEGSELINKAISIKVEKGDTLLF